LSRDYIGVIELILSWWIILSLKMQEQTNDLKGI